MYVPLHKLDFSSAKSKKRKIIDNIDYVTGIGNIINWSTVNAGFASGPALCGNRWLPGIPHFKIDARNRSVRSAALITCKKDRRMASFSEALEMSVSAGTFLMILL